MKKPIKHIYFVHTVKKKLFINVSFFFLNLIETHLRLISRVSSRTYRKEKNPQK